MRTTHAGVQTGTVESDQDLYALRTDFLGFIEYDKWLNLEDEELRTAILIRTSDISSVELRQVDGARVKFTGTTDRKIEAIKQVRAYSGCGLKEAKDIVEEATDRGGVATVVVSPDLSGQRLHVSSFINELTKLGLNAWVA